MLQCPTCGRRYSPDVLLCPQDGSPLQADATIGVGGIQGIPTADVDHRSDAEKLSGTVLDGKYRLDAPLGAGGMGTVFRATHLLIDRPVAIKILNPRLVSDASAQERLRREARAAGRLRHTNAVAVTDFGQTSDGVVYIVMELLEGVSLRDMLGRRNAPLEPELAIEIMLQTAAAVAAAHDAGIIHRDLKPGNIFILERAHNAPIVKVLDFGIAKVAAHEGEDGKNDVASAMTLTETGVMIGTPRYMSPEQCDGLPLTPAADVYSLGIILYEMLTGAPPFNGATPLSVALKHSAEAPRPLRETIPNIHPDLEAVVLYALAKRPEDRPRDAGEFRRELFGVAERLGMTRASGFSSPTTEMLREAGTETPSGRLIIDIERLRESRPVTGERGVATTAANTPPQDTIAVGKPSEFADSSGNAGRGATTVVRPSAPATSSAAAQSEKRSAAYAARAAGQGNTLAATRDWLEGTWRRRPALFVGASISALLFVYLLAALFSSRPSTTPPDSTTDSAKKIIEADDAVDRSGSEANATPNDAANARPVGEPQSALDFYNRGGYHFAQRAYDLAEQDFRRALELQQPFAEARNRLGRTLLAQGRFTPAVAEFRKAINEREGDYPVAQFNLGGALARAGERRAARAAYERAIELRGGDYPDAHYEIGMLLLAENRNDEAAAIFRRTIEAKQGNDPEAHFMLGVAEAKSRNVDAAESAFRTAIEQRGGRYPDAHYNLGLLYERNDRFADAVREYETYLEQQPNAANRRQVETVLRRLRRRAGL